MSARKVILLITGLLAIDQAVKFIVKMNFHLGESVTIFPDWLQISFSESSGQVTFILLRVAIVVALCWYISRLVKKKAPAGVMAGAALLTGGVLGNIIDNAFYGLIFSASTPTTTATLFPAGGGYAGFLQGKGIDMIYFRFSGTIINLADIFIFAGILCFIVCGRKFFKK